VKTNDLLKFGIVRATHLALTHRLRLSPISKRWRHFTWSIRGRCSKSDGSNKISATAGHMRNIFCCRDGVLAMFLECTSSTNQHTCQPGA